ncbi:unnamed protein product, partial [Iphiclides podalirius]
MGRPIRPRRFVIHFAAYPQVRRSELCLGTEVAPIARDRLAMKMTMCTEFDASPRGGAAREKITIRECGTDGGGPGSKRNSTSGESKFPSRRCRFFRAPVKGCCHAGLPEIWRTMVARQRCGNALAGQRKNEGLFLSAL